MDYVKYIIIPLWFLIPLSYLFIYCFDWRKCPKGGFHKFEFEEDIKIGKGWFGDMLVSIKGNNFYSDNKRYVCKKCFLVEKVED